MIYVDTSVVLATLLSEDRAAPPSFWQQTLVSSRLLTFEAWVRIHAKNIAASHAAQISALLGRIGYVEMDAKVLSRMLEPFPITVRTLDAFHLATAWFLQSQGQAIRVATFDERMAEAARRMKFETVDAAAE